MKPHQCEGCPLYEIGEGPVPPQIPSDPPSLVIVGEAPGVEEVREGVPFVGPSGKLLRALLRQAGVRPASCVITNVVWCRPPGNATPSDKTISFCSERWLWPLLRQHTGTNWLLAGSTASKLILNEPITECAGYVFRQTYAEPREQARGAAIVPILHPAALIRQPADIPSTVKFISKAIGSRVEWEHKWMGKDPLELFKVNPSPEELVAFVARARMGAFVVVDVETTSFTDMRLTAIGLASESGETISCAWNARVAAIVTPLLEDVKLEKVGYNIKFDAKALRVNGVELKGVWVDIMRLVQLDDIGTSRMSLEAVAPYYLSVESWKKKADAEGLLLYNARDALYEWAIFTRLRAKLLGSKRWALYERTRALERVVYRMEEVGFQIDTEKLLELRARVEAEYDQVLEAWKQKHGEINPHSPKQVLALFRELGIRLWKTNEGKESTEERYLKLSASRDKKSAAVILPLLRLRKLKKMASTYLDYAPGEDGALHTNVRTTGTVTGRFSFAEPNLGNIPKAKDEFGIRGIFVARPGYTLVNSDWSQAEARVTAILANETRMLEAWKEGKDIHKVTGAALFSVEESSVSKSMRELAKRILYGLSYGAGYRKLAEHAEIGFDEARMFIDRFRKAFPAYFEQLQEWNNRADEYGYLVNPFGRVHTFAGDRTATQSRNFVPQSTVADMMNIVLCQLYEEFEKRGLRSRVLLQVYDQVIVEAREDEVEVVREILARYMNQKWEELNSEVIPADVSVGVTWESL